MIVLNGEPFVRYNLRALYPFAHQIIVVEGACPAAAGVATPDGHSRDGTLAVLRDFQSREDLERKLLIVTAEDEGHPDGFWPGEKLQQSQAYARRATGDYLWQVDSDEFYQPRDMAAVLRRLGEDQAITAVSFPAIYFWGGFDYTVDGWYVRSHVHIYHRLFQWGPGYRYVNHRPPTVWDEKGQDLRTLRPLTGEEMEAAGVFLYHYCLLLPKQVAEKCEYYGRAQWANRGRAVQWAEDNFMRLGNPYRVHNVYEFPSWLDRFKGTHPPVIQDMRRDFAAGRIHTPLRRTEDIERLLQSPVYAVRKHYLKLRGWWDRRNKARLKGRTGS